MIKSEGLIYMVLEYGDIDLARLLQRHEAAQKEGGATELDENFIRLYWQQMLQVWGHLRRGSLLTCLLNCMQLMLARHRCFALRPAASHAATHISCCC